MPIRIAQSQLDWECLLYVKEQKTKWLNLRLSCRNKLFLLIKYEVESISFVLFSVIVKVNISPKYMSLFFFRG